MFPSYKNYFPLPTHRQDVHNKVEQQYTESPEHTDRGSSPDIPVFPSFYDFGQIDQCTCPFELISRESSFSDPGLSHSHSILVPELSGVLPRDVTLDEKNSECTGNSQAFFSGSPFDLDFRSTLEAHEYLHHPHLKAPVDTDSEANASVPLEVPTDASISSYKLGSEKKRVRPAQTPVQSSSIKFSPRDFNRLAQKVNTLLSHLLISMIDSEYKTS